VKSLIPKVMIVSAIAKKMTPVTTVHVSHSVGSQKALLRGVVEASEIGTGSRRIRDGREPAGRSSTVLRRIFDFSITRRIYALRLTAWLSKPSPQCLGWGPLGLWTSTVMARPFESAILTSSGFPLVKDPLKLTQG